MKASFIIPLYNCLPLTQAMLTSLRTTLPPDLSHEIILVDDGSTDGTRDWVMRLATPGRALLNERNLGFAATCNRGAAAATGEFLFFLNNDLVLLPGWFEPMLAVFARQPRAGLVGNVQLNHTTGAVDHTGIFFNHKGKPEHDTRHGPGLQDCRPVTALTGACFGVRRGRWIQLGGFDEGFVNGCEDIDLCLRAAQSGLVNYVARRSVVRHHISASPGRKARDEQNTHRLLQRWRTTILPQMVRPGCRVWLEAAWNDPRNYRDPQLARDALLYACHVWPATARLIQAASAMQEVEQNRWESLQTGMAVRPVREIAWQLFPSVPENPPIY